MSDIRERFEQEQQAAKEMPPEGEGPAPPAASSPTTPDEAPRSPRYDREARRHPPSVFWPLLLVGVGVMLLLSNLGYVPLSSWNVLWRLWPLLLIALGIDLLIGRCSTVGAIISGLLIFVLVSGMVLIVLFAQNIPILSQWVQAPELRTKQVGYPLAGVERTAVYIDWTGAPGYLSALENSPNLIEGDITYRGDLIFDVKMRGGRADVKLDSRLSGSWFGPWGLGDRTEERWDVMLSPKIPIELALDADSGPCDFNLSGLQVSSLVLDAGSGPIDLTLPSGSTFEAEIDGGSGPLTIILPQNVGARVELDSGSGAFRPDARFQLAEGKRRGDGVWETGNFHTAEHTILFEIDQGSGPISIR